MSKKVDRERPLFWLVIVNSILNDLENMDIAYAHVIVILLSVMVNSVNLSIHNKAKISNFRLSWKWFKKFPSLWMHKILYRTQNVHENWIQNSKFQCLLSKNIGHSIRFQIWISQMIVNWRPNLSYRIFYKIQRSVCRILRIPPPIINLSTIELNNSL